MASGEACQQIVDLSVPASQMIAPLYRTWWGEVFSWVSEAHWAAPGVSYWSHQDRWGHRHYWLGWFNFCILMSWARQYYTLVCFYRKFTNTLLSWIYLMIAFSCWAFFFFFYVKFWILQFVLCTTFEFWRQWWWAAAPQESSSFFSSCSKLVCLHRDQSRGGVTPTYVSITPGAKLKLTAESEVYVLFTLSSIAIRG